MKMENDFYCVQIDPQNGTIRRLFDKLGDLDLIAEPRLAENFRLLIPLPVLEANYILGKEQPAPAIETTSDGLVLHWDGPFTSEKGCFDLSATIYIEFVSKAIQIRIVVENRTEYKLAEVWHGMLGGLMGIGDRCNTRTMFPMKSGSALAGNIFQNFPESTSVSDAFGIRFPEWYASLSMLWMDMYNTELNCGFYVGCHETKPRRNTLWFEMHPGLARNRLSGNWPTEKEMASMDDQYPAGLVMSWVNLPYTEPGATFESPPVVFQSHEGDWHRAAKIYRSWFTSHFPIPKRHWLREQQAIQATAFLLPEGNVVLTFKDIPKWAKDALKYGVKTVLIMGWSTGGHDNQYPDYTPDPRLGTWEDLTEAIKACHEMGVKVLFFTNIQPVNPNTDWYKNELYRYLVITGNGQKRISGYGMGTLGARILLTCSPLTNCEPAFPEFRKIIVDQMRKLAEIGADGIHIDKMGLGFFDFNPDLEGGADEVYCRGLIQCIEEILEFCREINPDFCLSAESPWDKTLQYAEAWWNWHDTLDHVAAQKYTFPEYLPTFPVAQPWDYTHVNNAIRYGYQLLIGPGRFSCSMHDEQTRELSKYIAEVLSIREELKETIYLGDFLDTLEAFVKSSENVKYNTHRNPKTGKRACVLVNQSKEIAEASVEFLGNADGRICIYKPFDKVRTEQLPVKILIPGEYLAVVVEE